MLDAILGFPSHTQRRAEDRVWRPCAAGLGRPIGLPVCVPVIVFEKKHYLCLALSLVMNQPFTYTTTNLCLSFAETFTFSAKEKDQETGFSYFGSRYYSSDLSIWLSVDPQASKYPSFSPYVYCANNPIKLVDPNGEEIIAYDNYSKKMIKSYIKTIFGTNKLFRFSGNTLRVNKRSFNKYHRTASEDQKKLLDGFYVMCNKTEKAMVQVADNADDFTFEKSEAIRNAYGEIVGGRLTGKGAIVPNKGGGASVWSNFFSSYLVGIDNSVNDNLEAEDGGKTGNPAATFTHELLDEVLNYHVNKTINDGSSKLDKVSYQNTALRVMKRKQRNGNDHE